jgi:hypothetical protein
MKNNAGEKVRNIIRKEFDSRMEMAVVTYILDNGWEDLKEVTEEDILKVEGNGLMTKEFCQALVRASVRICKECDTFDDFLPFIVNYLYVDKAKMKEIELSKHGMKDYEWDHLLEEFDLYDEEDVDDIDMLVLNANVIETVKFD